MSIHIAILGIDGSGKSSVSSTLPALLAAELKVSAGSAGEEFRITTADGDHLGPSFDPKSLPLSIRLSKYFKKKAKKNVDNRKLYQVFKVAHMLFQDSSARKLESTYDPSIIISDGNAILSACGREINYRKVDGVSASTHESHISTEEISQLFEYLIHGESIPASTIAKMEKIKKIRKLKKLCSSFGLDTFWLPDFVFFLDISPEEAMTRIKDRGNKIDRHENITDLNNAREMYLKTLNALSMYQTKSAFHSIQVDKKSPGEVLNEILSIIKKKIKAKDLSVKRISPLLGKAIDDLENKNFLAKIFNRNYIINYLIKKFFKGAWREPFFICSSFGKQFLKEGYSADVMKIIYDHTKDEKNIFKRTFLGYPLHRAVYDRLSILEDNITPILRKMLAEKKQVTIFTAPCGFAYDILNPLNHILKDNPHLARKIKLIAADLDPYGRIEGYLQKQAEKLNIQLVFLKGDITSIALRNQFLCYCPYDLALFVGLSGWLPKPDIIHHISLLYKQMRKDGIFITDSFTASAYSLSGYYAGFKAHYYEPCVYKALMDYCGFDGIHAKVESGRDNINHVLVLKPKRVA